MKNKMKSDLSRELRSVHVSSDLKRRILTEAAHSRFPSRDHTFSLKPLAAAAAVIVIVGLSMGIWSLRTVRPDRSNVVFSDGGQDWVWVSPDDALYHIRKECGGIADAARMLLSDAKEDGRTACSSCIARGEATSKPEATVLPHEQSEENSSVLPEPTPEATSTPEPEHSASETNSPMVETYDADESAGILPEDFFWITGSGRYYHLNEHCSGMTGAQIASFAELFEKDLSPCPVCIPEEESFSAQSEISESSFDEDEYLDIDDLVWATSGGNYCHLLEHCSGMQGAQRMTFGDALLLQNKRSCPVCMEEQYVWMTKGGVCYHRAPNCSGMKNADYVTVGDAIWRGKKACSVCRESIPVYATENGRYYHFASDCSGMQGALRISEKEALARGQTRCPICSPLVETDEWYASIAESTLSVTGSQLGNYALISVESASEYMPIKNDNATCVDMDSKYVKSVLNSLSPVYMSAEQASEFRQQVETGEARGFRCVQYDLYALNSDGNSNAPTQYRCTDSFRQWTLVELESDRPVGQIQLGLRASEEHILFTEDDYFLFHGLLALNNIGSSGVHIEVTQKPADAPNDAIMPLSIPIASGDLRIFDAGRVDVRLLTFEEEQFLLFELAKSEQNDDSIETAAAIYELMNSLEVEIDGMPLPIASNEGGRSYGDNYAAFRLPEPADLETLEISFTCSGEQYNFYGKDMTVQ